MKLSELEKNGSVKKGSFDNARMELAALIGLYLGKDCMMAYKDKGVEYKNEDTIITMQKISAAAKEYDFTMTKYCEEWIIDADKVSEYTKEVANDIRSSLPYTVDIEKFYDK